MERRLGSKMIKKESQRDGDYPIFLSEIMTEYNQAVKDKDVWAIENCKRDYQLTRDNAIRCGEDVSNIPRRLK